ncbi:MAG: ribonuclease III [Cyanobium sp. MAG06]|nr:ribonuclease III [Cyanobium sp. MAG06]
MEELLNKLNIKYNSLNIYEQAFTHRSYINENPKNVSGHNERLEFLGDAVLELLVSEYLYKKYPNITEGELTSIRSAMVNTHTLAKTAEDLQFNQYLKLSKGESKDTGKARISILADTFEAFLGGIYLDCGLSVSKIFLENNLFNRENDARKDTMLREAKSIIQEYSQDKLGITPSYKVIEEKGPDHNKDFVVGIYFGTKEIATGTGKSKQEAETSAAQNAMHKLY